MKAVSSDDACAASFRVYPAPRRRLAGENVTLHPMRKKDPAVQPQEFDIPAAATADGTLSLEWQPDPAESGNGRFVQVNEVWLIRAK